MQAMLITAYRDYASLRRAVAALSQHALCFVHVDMKSPVTPEEIAQLCAMENVYAERRYRVNWGSVYHLYALLSLMRRALGDPRVTHLHLMSAQDFPTVSHAELEARFAGDARVHMQRLRLADFPELEHRYRHFHAMHLIDYRDPSDRVQTLVGRIDRFQDALRVRRRLDLTYKGMVWCSLPRAAAEAACSGQAGKLLRKLRWTYIPEEFYFQNVLSDAGFEIADNLRFSIWDEPERGLPALLTLDDLPRIDASGCAFARKVDAGTPLYEALERRWLA